MEIIFVFVVIIFWIVPMIIYGTSLLFNFIVGNKQEEKRDFQIELLIEAQERIERQENKFICAAIDFIKLNSRLSEEEILWCNEILDIIQDSLWPYDTLEGWLADQGIHYSKINMVEYRSQFIDQLIDYIADRNK